MYAVPFLIELLKVPSIAEKARIVVLIGEIATGNPPMHQIKTDAVNWSSVLAARGRSLERELANERVYADGIRQLVKSALPTLVPYLQDTEPAVRRVMADVLSRYPELSDQYLPVLRQVLAGETDTDVKADIERAIERLLA
jgi:hypothetical protein